MSEATYPAVRVPVGSKSVVELAPGEYMGPMEFGGRDRAVVFKVPEGTVSHNSLCHISEPPWTIRECEDGSLEIRDSIAMKRGDGSNEWHGLLDAGNVWRVLDA